MPFFGNNAKAFFATSKKMNKFKLKELKNYDEELFSSTVKDKNKE